MGCGMEKGRGLDEAVVDECRCSKPQQQASITGRSAPAQLQAQDRNRYRYSRQAVGNSHSWRTPRCTCLTGSQLLLHQWNSCSTLDATDRTGLCARCSLCCTSLTSHQSGPVTSRRAFLTRHLSEAAPKDAPA